MSKAKLSKYMGMGMPAYVALNTAIHDYEMNNNQPFKIAMSKETFSEIATSQNVEWVKIDNSKNEYSDGKVGYYQGVEIEYNDNLENGVIEFKRIMEE